MKNIFHGINSRVDEAKNQISNLEYKEAKKKTIRIGGFTPKPPVKMSLKPQSIF